MDYATINTARYTARYTSCKAVHTATLRFPSAAVALASGATVLEEINAFLVYYLATDFAWLDAVVYGKNSSVGTPCDTPAASPGAGVPKKPVTAKYLKFQARSSLGSLFSFSIFGIGLTEELIPGEDYRFQHGESAAVTAALDYLTTGTPCVGIDGGSLTWKKYANFGISAYWQRKIRKG